MTTTDYSKCKTLCIDFDGVIHKYSQGWLGENPYDQPMEGALDTVLALQEKGFHIVVLTARDNFEPVKKWLKKYGFPDLEVTNIKLPATAYIDDRAIRFTNWKDIANYFI